MYVHTSSLVIGGGPAPGPLVPTPLASAELYIYTAQVVQYYSSTAL